MCLVGKTVLLIFGELENVAVQIVNLKGTILYDKKQIKIENLDIDVRSYAGN